MRETVVLVCTECERRNYTASRNKRTQPNKLEVRKYCKHCGKHVLHRETK